MFDLKYGMYVKIAEIGLVFLPWIDETYLNIEF